MKVTYFVQEGFLIASPRIFVEPEGLQQLSESAARNYAASQLREARNAGATVKALTRHLWKITFPPGRLAASGLLKITG